MTKKEKQTVLEYFKLQLYFYGRETNKNDRVYSKIAVNTAGRLAYKLGITDEELNNVLKQVRAVDPFIIGDTTHLNNCKFYRGQLQ